MRTVVLATGLAVLLIGGPADNEVDFFYRGKGFSEDELQDDFNPDVDILITGSLKPHRGQF